MIHRQMTGVGIGLIATLLMAVPAVAGTAADAPPRGGGRLVEQIRIGVLHHDVDFFAFESFESGVDFNLELLLRPILTSPRGRGIRPILGLSLNSKRQTNVLYGGLEISAELPWSFFFDLSGGLALHDGDLECCDRFSRHKSLGWRVLFRYALALGVEVNDRIGVMLFFDHASNAYLADDNPGLTNVGLRFRIEL